MTRDGSAVIVVGAGVFGVTAALELRRRGHRVTLLDTGPVPRDHAASTDISKAVRMDYGADEFYTALMERAFEGWDAWNAAWTRPLYHQTGFLLLCSEPMAAGGFEHESLRVLERRGHVFERLDRERLRRRFPMWNAARYADGYLNPRGGLAESGPVVSRLAADARAAGVALLEGAGMRSLVEDGSRVVGVRTSDGETHRADHVIVAAGAWTPTLLPELQDVMWAVGQAVFHFRPREPQTYRPAVFPTWASDIAHTGWYGFPVNQGGILKVANHGPGRRVEPDEPRTVDREAEARFRAFLDDALPGLAGAPVERSRLCLYCDTFDGNFWIDRHPKRPGLFVAAGGSGHAFKFAPVLGRVIADRFEDRRGIWDERFAWRSPRERVTEAARFL